MSLGRLGLYLRARLSRRITGFANRHAPPMVAASLEAVLDGAGDPLSLVRLLEGRTNADREAAVERWLAARRIPFTTHRFQRVEGRGTNYVVDIGSGARALVLIAHHDAVPGSPGANDNAIAVGILLTLLERLREAPPRQHRVRLLFTAAEEMGYLGARAYVADTPLDDVAGVLSLELCGIGDSLVLWDATDDTAFVTVVRRAFERLGLRAEHGYHVVGRIPVFGSDHRAFAPTVPAYGLSAVPLAQADALRGFVFRPVRSALMHLVRRPPPFDTYHTPRDRAETLDASAAALVLRALEAVVAELA